MVGFIGHELDTSIRENAGEGSRVSLKESTDAGLFPYLDNIL